MIDVPEEMLPPEIETVLSEVARETGRSRFVVERAYRLKREAFECRVLLMVEDGEIFLADHPEMDGELPSCLEVEINESKDDLIELLPALARAVHRAVTGRAE